MKISKLLELDSRFNCKESLSKNIGDSFLFQHNSIFKKIRKTSLEAGFSFSSEFDFSYLALGLAQLTPILQSKKIPYFDNVTALEQVESKISSTTLWDEVVDNLKKNYVFHEACHAVARSFAEAVLLDQPTQDKKILQLLLEESFSNACELLGIIDVGDSLHRIFYEANSYIFVFESRTHLKNLVKSVGFKTTLKFLILSYLHSNYLFESIPEKNFLRMLKMLDVDSKEVAKNMRALSKIAFELNPRFRMVTTGFYLRLSGYNVDSKNLKNFDFISTLEADTSFLAFLNYLAVDL